MTELFSNAASAIATVSLATLLVSLGYVIRAQFRMVRTQGEMLAQLARIGMALEGLSDLIHGGSAAPSLHDAERLIDGDWRNLPADDVAKLRDALANVLAQMAREAPPGGE
jgi:hypothetical protein